MGASLGVVELSVALHYIFNTKVAMGSSIDMSLAASPTDVLSFAQREGEDADPNDPVLGDIIISVQTAQRQASQRGYGIAKELRVLLVHGMLHLLGHDHLEPGEAAKMQAEERRLLSLLGEDPEVVRPLTVFGGD